MKFRKRPVAIEAFQMTEDRRMDYAVWPDWLKEAKEVGDDSVGGLFHIAGEPGFFIGTLEGAHRVSWNDWIIKGVHGELYPCKPDIFDLTYEPVDEASEP